MERSRACLGWGGARSSRAMTVVIIVRRHRPRKRTIQYAAAYRMSIGVSVILGRPVKPGDDSCVLCSARPPPLSGDPIGLGAAVPQPLQLHPTSTIEAHHQND